MSLRLQIVAHESTGVNNHKAITNLVMSLLGLLELKPTAGGFGLTSPDDDGQYDWNGYRLWLADVPTETDAKVQVLYVPDEDRENFERTNALIEEVMSKELMVVPSTNKLSIHLENTYGREFSRYEEGFWLAFSTFNVEQGGLRDKLRIVKVEHADNVMLVVQLPEGAEQPSLERAFTPDKKFHTLQ